MARILGWALILLLLLLSLGFAALNAEPVEFHFYFSSIKAPLSIVIALAFVLGAVVGLVTALGRVLRHKREVIRLKRAVRLAEQEVENLRNIPIKDSH